MGLGSGIRKKPIPDPGSRGQKGTGSRIRIGNTAVLTLDGDGDDEDADGGADEGAGVAHRQQALALDELRHLGGEVAQVRLHVVLQNQARQRPKDERKKACCKEIREGFFIYFFSYYIQHCFICRPSDSAVPTERMLGSNPGPLQLVHWQSDALTTRLYLIRML
jgi:hypothetical protein